MVGERNISVSFKADGTSDTWVQKWPLRVVRIMTGEQMENFSSASCGSYQSL
jgi:hypothetical protein